MYHMTNLKEGQSVLIHSATGWCWNPLHPVGSVQKAEIIFLKLFTMGMNALTRLSQIYVTVVTEEKRQLLKSTYGTPRSQMFFSRNPKFEQGILRETGGRGIDCIVNFLVGELLDAS
ncbi:polyketide synthase 2 [Penicillium coprophilum]|uniref:polyketide synthase 2 n=1 Tax=Penicillium coprophilum TaxID=36646 RepID=UPI0023A4000C|nr:polyketide synthase 2 [Penicillium coprophilum]KAJ5150721.1 polyketide synthase 2 [Penicillium coprophilum]